MINLLPQSIKESRSYGRKNTNLFGYSVALLGTAFLTASIMFVGIKFIGSDEPSLRKKITEDQATVANLEKDVKNIESIASRLETAKQISSNSISFSELIPKIGAVLPQGVVLNALSFTGGPTDPLQLDVDLLNASLAPVLVKNLVESGIFEAADISTLSPLSGSSDVAKPDSYQFTATLTASFTGTADATKKAAAVEAAKKAASDAATANAPKEKN